MLDPLDTSDKCWGDANYKGFIPWDKVKNEGRTMSEEIKSIFKSRNYWMAFAISFLTLLGYSLSSWLNAVSVGESMGIPRKRAEPIRRRYFLRRLHAVVPVLRIRCARNQSGGRAAKRHGALAGMRGSVARYVGVRRRLDAGGGAGDDERVCAARGDLERDCPAVRPGGIRRAYDLFFGGLRVCRPVHGLLRPADVCGGCRGGHGVFGGGLGGDGAGDGRVVPDKMMAFTIPSFIYYLWSADAAGVVSGLSIPHPASLFNDGLSRNVLRAALASYGVLFAVSLAAYCAGCESEASPCVSGIRLGDPARPLSLGYIRRGRSSRWRLWR